MPFCPVYLSCTRIRARGANSSGSARRCRLNKRCHHRLWVRSISKKPYRRCLDSRGLLSIAHEYIHEQRKEDARGDVPIEPGFMTNVLEPQREHFGSATKK